MHLNEEIGIVHGGEALKEDCAGERQSYALWPLCVE